MQAFADVHPHTRVTYAGKAGLSFALLQIIAEEGLALDVVSGGELGFALAAGFPAERIHFHGNNKTPDELRAALDAHIDAIVIDGFDEIELLAQLTAGVVAPQDVLLRLNPGIDVHTHDYRKTGIPDSKFGLGIASGDAAEAVERILAVPGVRLRGYHAHIGSQIFELEPFVDTVETIFAFAAAMRDRFGVEAEEISPGGGFGIAYEAHDPEPAIEQIVVAIADATEVAAARYQIRDPLLTIEPGRSIVGAAGVAIYTVGARKAIPGIRTYVSVDGGMADNIRPALYGAVYTAELVRQATAGAAETEVVTIAGKYCESGDILIERIGYRAIVPGDLLVIPLPEPIAWRWRELDLSFRPAVVFVEDGNARLIQRRETLDDLLRREVPQSKHEIVTHSVSRSLATASSASYHCCTYGYSRRES